MMERLQPVLTRRLAGLLNSVFLLFALMAVNSVYLLTITVLEAVSGKLFQDRTYLLMFLAHLALGLLLTLPFILFVSGHLPRALKRPNRDAIRAGLGLLVAALLVLLSGILLTRFGFLEINDPIVRRIAYWLHVISPLAVIWLFVLHRLAGPPILWRKGWRWSLAAFAFAVTMLVLDAGVLRTVTTQAATAFPPSQAQLAGQHTIPAQHLMTDRECAGCHADITSSHQYSMHRFSSMNNPAYAFSVNEARRVILQRDGNLQATRFCAACHDPVPLFSGKFDDPAIDLERDPSGQAGITCISCHAITRINGQLGNGDYTIVDPPQYPFADSDSAILKTLNHLLIRAKPEFHKQTLLKPLHRSAEFCSVCHKVSLPESLNHYRWLRGQDHYDSFLQSGISGHRVDSFYYPQHAFARCSVCHMPLQASDDPAARDFDESGTRSVHTHRFAAANTGVTQMLGLPEEVLDAQRKRLADVTRIDIFGIKDDGRVDGTLHAPLRPALPVLQAGHRYLVEVVIRNTGVGHHLTEGTADSNQLWVELTATGQQRTIGQSGGMDEHGAVDPWSYFVNAYVLDRDGERIDRRNAQDVFVALYNHQVPPGAASVVHYLLEVPPDAGDHITLEASLNYRKFDTTYLQHIEGDRFRCNDLPVTVMASDRITLPVNRDVSALSSQSTTLAAAERWNDYGIGLLRGGDELRQAEQAFHQVEQLGRGDGALNLARVYYRTGQLPEAADALTRASAATSPAMPWTIAWYSALIDRQNGRLDTAIDALESIADTRFSEARLRGFDFSYDTGVQNELGRTLYERARQLRGAGQVDARKQSLVRAQQAYERTLAIDPEDATAHFNLSRIYAELGDTEQATQQRVLHEQYRTDDTAIERAVTRHRAQHPAADHAAADLAIYPLDRPDNAYTVPGHPAPACQGDRS
jgi:Tetratricopeptide repeat/Cytochrome c554 and c-prime